MGVHALGKTDGWTDASFDGCRRVARDSAAAAAGF